MILQERFEDLTRFMGQISAYPQVQVALFGMPMDFTVSYHPGSRFGPAAIREASWGLEDWSPLSGGELANIRYTDLGDIIMPSGNTHLALERIGEVAEQILSDNVIPFGFGGDHLVSLPVIKAVYKKYPDLRVVHLDAHADLRAEYAGETHTHATVMGRVVDFLGADRLYQFGIRSGTKEEFARAQHLFSDVRLIADHLEVLEKYPIYVSMDIDVVDPAFAPGTGTQEPGGATSREILEATGQLGQLQVVGFDLVEVLPQLDYSGRTAALAAKVVREMLCALALKS